MPLLPAAVGIILDERQACVLLVQRRDVPLWVLPGGGVEPEETPEEALKREVNEETGYEVLITRKCAEYTPINRLAAFTSIFLCRIQSGKLSLSPETASVAFHPLANLPPSFFLIHARWLQEALRHPSLIQRPLTEVSYAALAGYFLRHPWQTLRFARTRLKNL